MTFPQALSPPGCICSPLGRQKVYIFLWITALVPRSASLDE